MKLTVKWIMLFVLLFSGTMIGQSNASPLQKEKEADTFEPPENIYSLSESLIEILHIADEDEYIIEWTGQSETWDTMDAQQGISFLFEDGYLKDMTSAWSEDRKQVSTTKQTSSEDTGRYNVISFHSIKKAPVFSYDWSETSLYVLNTPMTDLHSFRKPKSKEEEKSKQILDTIIRQQHNHIKRIIREKAELPENVVLFPIYDVASWNVITDTIGSHVPQTRVEKIWNDIYQQLIQETKKLQSSHKKGMPFISWNKNDKKLSLYIHYGHI